VYGADGAGEGGDVCQVWDGGEGWGGAVAGEGCAGVGGVEGEGEGGGGGRGGEDDCAAAAETLKGGSKRKVAKSMWLLHACIDTYIYPHVHNMPVVGEACLCYVSNPLSYVPSLTPRLTTKHAISHPSPHQYPLASPNGALPLVPTPNLR